MTETIIARPEWVHAKSGDEFDPRGGPMVELAWLIAKIAHRGQTRKNLEPYINHVAAVASIVRDVFGITDPEVVASSILHDVVEDCGQVSAEQLEEISELVGSKVESLDLKFISQIFGEKTAFSVDSVTKLSSDRETVRKLLVQVSVDPIGAIDKLADRLHNMSTLYEMEFGKQIEKARETLNIYTHLAESLGIWVVKNKLEDLAFEYLEPERYLEVRDLVDSDPRLNSGFIQDRLNEWNKWLELQGVDGRVEVRVKGYWEANQKRKRLIEEARCRQPETFADVADLVSFRILVNNLGDADILLGRLRRDCKEIIDVKRADDFITEEADNGYSAYHEVLNIDGNLVEIAITTEEREDFNNWGVVSLLRAGSPDISKYARIMVFSPNNELHFLPQGATGVDYARAISPRLLAQAVGMVIDDGEMVDIREKIPNAAAVRIITDSQRMAADPSWVNHCSTRAAIREIERQQEQVVRRELVAVGKQRMEVIIRERGLFELEDLDEETFKTVRYSLDVGGKMSDIYTKLGAGTLNEERVGKKLDEAGVVKETDGVRVTSLRVEGPDIEGTFAFLTGLVAEKGGSLSFSINRADGEKYAARLVIYGLKMESEEEIKQTLAEDNRFSRVDLA